MEVLLGSDGSVESDIDGPSLYRVGVSARHKGTLLWSFCDSPSE